MNDHTLVSIFLRGGADGLALVPPVGDDAYHRLRPTLAIREGIRLDDRFHLAPELAALRPLWDQGRLTIAHAVGTEDDTRSHFVAQPLCEHGGRNAVGGWIARWLLRCGAGPLGGIAFGEAVPESLRGAAGAVAVRDLADLLPGTAVRRHRDRLAALYADDDLLGPAATATLEAGDRLTDLVAAGTAAPSFYPTGTFAHHLAQTSSLIRADLGVRACCLDLQGWDSHVGQGHLLGALMRELAEGLAAFVDDLGSLIDRTSIVVLSEFGRRVGENSGLGTDHGHGFAALVLGGGTPGGVLADWPGLEAGALIGPGDLAGTTDWRSLLAGILRRHGLEEPGALFPGAPPPLPGV